MKRAPMKTAITVAAAFAVAAPTAAGSSMTVIRAIEHEDRLLDANPAEGVLTKLDKTKNPTRAEIDKALPTLESLQKLMVKAAAAVADSSTSSAKQVQGRSDWVAGMKDQATEYAAIVTELKDVLTGNKTGAGAEYKLDVKWSYASQADFDKASKLLGFQTSD